MRFTVFTPTYNRAYIIENLYQSLQRQTFQDFEWIVINDGSADNTDELFARIVKDNNSFPIRYIKVANGGKHRAINKGLKIAKGELFFIVDSDDYLTDDALEIADKIEKGIKADEKKQFCGICGLKGYSSDTMVGTSFSGKEYLDITSLERRKYNITGDKSEIYYTNILKKYPFPEFDGEKFVTEAVVWDHIAHDGYKFRYFNKIIYICNYQSDGLSSKYTKLLEDNPKGYGLYLNQETQYGSLTGLNKWQKYLSYYYAERGKLKFRDISKNLGMKTSNLYWRLFFMRLFYKFYDN